SAALAAAPAGSFGGATSIAASRTSRPSSNATVRPSTTAVAVPAATVASLHSEVCALLAAGESLPAAVCACAAVAAVSAAARLPTKNPLPMATGPPPPHHCHHATAPMRRG